MAFAQGSRAGLVYVVESSFGTTPGSPSMIDLPLNSHSLNLSKTPIESAEIRSDRQTAIYRHGNKRVQGELAVDFRADAYDDFLESAFFNAFTAGVLKVGTTPKFMTIEDQQLDISQYRVFTGCMVNTFSLSVKPDAIVTANFGLIGKGMSTPSGSPLDASPTAAGDNDPFDAFSGVITENNSPIASVSSVEFTLNNNAAHAFVIGNADAAQLEYGRAQIEGNITVYYEDATLINKFINETESSLAFSLDDGVSGNTYTFEFPRIKYNGADVPIENEQSRLITMPFVGLYDSASGTNLIITKN